MVARGGIVVAKEGVLIAKEGVVLAAPLKKVFDLKIKRDERGLG